MLEVDWHWRKGGYCGTLPPIHTALRKGGVALATKTHPFQAQILYSTSASTAASNFTALSDVKSISPGGVEFGETDTTHLQSANAFKESIASWGKEKPISLVLYYDETMFNTLLQSVVNAYARATLTWQVQIPDATAQATSTSMVVGSRWFATAYVGDLEIKEMSAGSDDAVMMDMKLIPTGRPIFQTS